MESVFKERIKFWDISYPNHTDETIAQFEKDRNLKIPGEYRQLLTQLGKLKFVKTWFLYYELNEGYDHLVSDSFSIEDQYMIWRNFWAEIEKANPNLQANKYLPIFGTHSPNFLFLIGLTDEQTGKIYEYDSDYEDFKPIEIAVSFEDFFISKIYSQYDINPNSMIGSIDIFKRSGVEIWDIREAKLHILGNQACINLESSGKLITRTENTNEGLEPTFSAQFEFPSSVNLINPTEFVEEKIKEAQFEYFDIEVPINLKIGIVKGFEEIYYVKIEGEIVSTYEWESDRTKFRITFKQEKVASS